MAKYTAAFFMMAHSSATRLSSAFRPQNSSVWGNRSGGGLGATCCSPIHLHRLWVLTPSRADTPATVDPAKLSGGPIYLEFSWRSLLLYRTAYTASDLRLEAVASFQKDSI